MIITTLTEKNQTTLGMDFVKALGIGKGAKLRQTFDGQRIVIEPIGDVMSAYGVFKKSVKQPLPTIREEKNAAAMAIAKDAMKAMRNE